MERSKRNVLVALLLLLIAFAGGGMTWLLARRALFSRTDRTFVCVECAAQTSEKTSQILEVHGKPATNHYITKTRETLRAYEECSHAWLLAHETRDRVNLLPMPQGVTTMHIHLDLRGITDKAGFDAALSEIATTNLPEARRIWSNLVRRIHGRVDPAATALKQSLARSNSHPVTVRLLRSFAEN